MPDPDLLVSKLDHRVLDLLYLPLDAVDGGDNNLVGLLNLDLRDRPVELDSSTLVVGEELFPFVISALEDED